MIALHRGRLVLSLHFSNSDSILQGFSKSFVCKGAVALITAKKQRPLREV
jgi:hypothetical protein